MGAGAAAIGGAPMFFTRHAYGAEFLNNPGDAGSVTLGFNVPQSGAYAEEGADELRAYQLAVKHLNGEGDGGMMNTFKPSALKGNGILGKKVEYVTGDTQTKSDAARASAKRMIEKDGALMITGGSSSGVAVAVQGLCQDHRHHLHGRSHPLQRHHRQGQEGQRLPPLLQRLHVGRGARSRCSRRPTAPTARPTT